ncbi:MAG: hypothetical protein WCH34_04225 [Bacteroidota bacterium]
MKTFIARSDSALNKQLRLFCSNIDSVSGLLSINGAKIIQIKKDSVNFDYLLTGAKEFKDYGKSVVASKTQLRMGTDESLLINIIPPQPWPTPVPTNIVPGIQHRFANLIQDCTNSSNFREDIGVLLGIIKPHSIFTPEDGKPNAKGKLAQAGLPEVKATIGKYDGYSIYKDSGDGYKFYDKSAYHKWVDKREPLPHQGTTEVWKYKLIYNYKNEEVGAYSNEIVIVVYGNV